MSVSSKGGHISSKVKCSLHSHEPLLLNGKFVVTPAKLPAAKRKELSEKHMAGMRPKEVKALARQVAQQYFGTNEFEVREVGELDAAVTFIVLQLEDKLVCHLPSEPSRPMLPSIVEAQAWVDEKKTHDSSFVWVYNVDSDGVLQDLFWTTESQLSLFRRHGDVLILDTTYGTIAYVSG
jgi:hypothetical protein